MKKLGEMVKRASHIQGNTKAAPVVRRILDSGFQSSCGMPSDRACSVVCDWTEEPLGCKESRCRWAFSRGVLWRECGSLENC